MDRRFPIGVFLLASVFFIVSESKAHDQYPIAIIDDCPKYTCVDSTVQFDGSNSYDPDGGPITDYDWDFPAEASDITGGSTAEPNCVFDSAGIYVVRLRVQDDENWWSTWTSCNVFVSTDPNRVHNITQAIWYSHIQLAIDDANTNDELEVQQGSCYEFVDFDGKDMILRSPDPNDWDIVSATIIDGNNMGTVVTFYGTESSDCRLLGLTITNGYGPTDQGGGIDGDSSGTRTSATIATCIIKNNATSENGGGIQGVNGLIDRCKIYGNSADNNAGGLTGCHGTVRNCLVYENTATSNGGGMVNCNGDIINCTVANNTAGVSGGGLAWCGGTTTNCIVWGNNLEQVAGGVAPTYSCIQDWTDGGTGNISSDPCFVDAGSDDYHLNSDSPCIDAGDPNGDYDGQKDIDGDPRVIATGVDMGADEFGVHNIDQDNWYLTIQDAIDNASEGDTIVAPTGRYYEQIDFKGKGITVASTDPCDADVVAATIIDADDTSSGVNTVVFDSQEDSDSILNGMTITGGYRGIYCVSSSPRIINCIISSNSSRGLTAVSSSSPTITNCTFTGHGGLGGYGLGCGSSSPIISRCIFTDNTQGIYLTQSSAPSITNCLIVNNTNMYTNYGIYSNLSSPTVINCTILGNEDFGISGACAQIKNCILWDNGDDLNGCSATYSCIQDKESGTGNIRRDPRFANPSNGDYHLKMNSMCINAGDPASDYSKEPAPNGGRINMGAYGNTSEATTGMDEDNDGMSDVWELYYWPGEDPNDHDPEDDPDGDGISNIVEYQIGWLPTEDNSSLIDGYVENDATGLIYPSINDAIMFASDSETIILDPNTYYETIDFNNMEIHIRSIDPNDPNVVASTIVDANDVSANVVVFNLGENANSVIEGITITGGYAGIDIDNSSSPNISKCVITENSYIGISCSGSSSPTVTGCTVTYNAERGFGIVEASSPIVTNCTFSGHVFGPYAQGYGLTCHSSSPTISDCTFSDNREGISLSSSAPTISGCTIANNSTSEENYGIYSVSSSPTITNCLIIGNDDYGIKGPCTKIENCTVVGNEDYGIYGATIEVKNCILWDNGDDDLYNCTATYSCVQDGATGAGNIDGTASPFFVPAFIDPDNADYHLKFYSLCIDVGDPSSDYSNEPAPNGDRINMGAYGNTSEATIGEDEDGDGISDGWEYYYWPGDDPNLHNPNDDPDGDGFSNWVEYLFGYDPNQSTTATMELMVFSFDPHCEFDPIKGETVTIDYAINMNVTIDTRFKHTDNGETVRTISEVVTAGLHQVVWDGIDANDVIAERYFYDVVIEADDGEGNNTSWTSLDRGDTPSMVLYDRVIDCDDYNRYRNMPVRIDTSSEDWCTQIIDIVKDKPDGWTDAEYLNYLHNNPDDETYRICHIANRLMDPEGNTFYWYGRWGLDMSDPNAGSICQLYANVFFDISAGVNKGEILVFYQDMLSNLLVDPYCFMPLYDETTTISFDLAYNAYVTVDIYDSNEDFFVTLVDDVLYAAGSHEVLWYGRDGDPNDADSNYIYEEGAYRIEVKAEKEGLVEKLQGTVTVYR